VKADRAGPFAKLEHVFLKNETANPTWCSKDRGNAVTASVGRMLEVGGVVAVTTGNHGASVAAYCGHASLSSVILMNPQSDIVHRAMVVCYGGVAVITARWEPYLRHLAHEFGWFPATSMGYAVAPNPFGVEAYKTIAFELFEDLDGVPDAVLVPVASGDLLYGIYKGFRELQALGLTRVVPRLIGCQASGAAALAAAFRSGRDDIPVLEHPETIATSIADATSDRHALEALRASGGDVVTVTDEEILAAQRYLSAHGLLVELASAAAAAAASEAARTGILRAGDRVVCVLTGAGTKWSAQLLANAMHGVLLEPPLAMVDDLVRRSAKPVG
jgi:threonine synthase